jgi:hypothetical protein
MTKRKSEIQVYLKERVNPIIEPLTLALVKSRPENIILFCIDWFNKYSNFHLYLRLKLGSARKLSRRLFR